MASFGEEFMNLKKIMGSVLVAGLLVSLLILVSCNTTKGVGKDIEKAGDGLKDSADRNGAD